MEGVREEGREGEMEGGREGGRDGGREGEEEVFSDLYMYSTCCIALIQPSQLSCLGSSVGRVSSS